MAVAFNHTIVHSRNRHDAGAFFAETMGLPAPTECGPFLVVALADHASFDFMQNDGDGWPS